MTGRSLASASTLQNTIQIRGRWALGNLCTKIVSLLHHANNPVESLESQVSPREILRDAILMCRDQVGQYPHRDQLEILLFATKVLLEHGNEPNRFQRQQDSDLLLSFCHIALNPYQFEEGRSATESTAYPLYRESCDSDCCRRTHRVKSDATKTRLKD